MFVQHGAKMINLSLVATGEVGQVSTRGVRPVTLRDAAGRELATVPEHVLTTLDTETVLAGPLAGLVLVATGRLEGYTRQEIEERIRQLGGVVGDNVTKKTSYVIVGADAGSKADKATRLGVPILSEQAFEALVAERSRPGAPNE